MHCFPKWERVLFRRLAVFLGGFDLAAARAVSGGAEVERYLVLDQPGLLVEVTCDRRKRQQPNALPVARDGSPVRDGELGQSGEAASVRLVTAITTRAWRPCSTRRLAEITISASSRSKSRWTTCEAHSGGAWNPGDVGHALELASWLQPLWLTRGRIVEGLACSDLALGGEGSDDAEMSVERVRALAERSALAGWIGKPGAGDAAKQALIRARELDDPALVVRALTGICCDAVWILRTVVPISLEAPRLARELGDLWRLSQILGRQANAGVSTEYPVAAVTAGEEGLEIAEAIGDRFSARWCRWAVASAQFLRGDLAAAVLDEFHRNCYLRGHCGARRAYAGEWPDDAGARACLPR